MEGAIQQILDMGGGTWDRDTVLRALRAAFNNPERAVEYLYSVRGRSMLFTYSNIPIACLVHMNINTSNTEICKECWVH